MDDALYFISLLMFKTAHGMVNENGYANLNFDILSKIMLGRTLRKIKESLQENGVIQCDGIAIPGIKSLGYRLHPKFCNDTAIFKTIKKGRMSRSLDRYYERKLVESKALWLPVHHELNRHQHMLEIDMDQANAAIQKLEPKVKKPKSKTGNRRKYDPEEITRRTILAQSHLCESIKNKTSILHVGTTKRAYNSVTSLSRELRPSLRYKGKQLESVDIRNSQPALLRKLVEDDLESGDGEPGIENNASHIGTRCPDCLEPCAGGTASHIGTRGRDSRYQDSRGQDSKDQDSKDQEGREQGSTEERDRKQGDLYDLRFPDDFMLYSELTANGLFYNFMWEAVQRADYRFLEEAIKTKFLTDIFAKKKWVRGKSGVIFDLDYDSAVEDVFRELFPTVYEFICRTNKTDPGNGVTFLKSHSVLIRMLQQSEAKLVIEGAAPLALAHRSQPLVLTCHDAFFCGAGEAAIFDKCLMLAAASQGHRIKTKTTYFR